MRKARKGTVVLLLVLAGWPGAAAAEPAATIADLAWMAGHWSATDGDGRYEEHWTAPADNALLGMARNLSAGRMVFFEFLRIEQREDGIYFVAQPGGRPGTDFRLTGFDGAEAVFENPRHDYPRRITYRRGGDGAMTARIDGGPGSEAPVTTFSFRRLEGAH